MKKPEPQALAPIAQARLQLHPSHRRMALDAAARCTAGWPSTAALAAGADPLRLSPDGIWTRGGRRDSDDDSDALGLRTDGVGYSDDAGFRMDGPVTTDPRVADAALAVMQGLAAVSRCWPRMNPQARALAQQATCLSHRLLKQAGIRPADAIGEAI